MARSRSIATLLPRMLSEPLTLLRIIDHLLCAYTFRIFYLCNQLLTRKRKHIEYILRSLSNDIARYLARDLKGYSILPYPL